MAFTSTHNGVSCVVYAKSFIHGDTSHNHIMIRYLSGPNNNTSKLIGFYHDNNFERIILQYVNQTSPLFNDLVTNNYLSNSLATEINISGRKLLSCFVGSIV